MVYPVLHVERDDEGHVVAVRPSREGERRESLVHCEVGLVTDPEVHAQPGGADSAHPGGRGARHRRLRCHGRRGERGRGGAGRAEPGAPRAERPSWRRSRPSSVGSGTGASCSSDTEATTSRPCRARTPRRSVWRAGSGLGLLRDESQSVYARAGAARRAGRRAARAHRGTGPSLIISKTNAESPVHRRARMDYIGVKKLSPEGEVVGEHRFLGLFTSKAYSEDAENIPILRHKLHQILDESGVREGSHDYKEIITIFNSLPKEELFLTSAEEVGSDIRTVLTSYNTAGVRVTLREDPLHRGVSVMVIVPKDKFSGERPPGHRGRPGGRLRGRGPQLPSRPGLAATRRACTSTWPPSVSASSRWTPISWSRPWAASSVRGRTGCARGWSGCGHPTRRGGWPAATGTRSAPSTRRPPIRRSRWRTSSRSRPCGRRGGPCPSASPTAAVERRREAAVTELKVYVRGERLILSDFMPILENSGLRVIAVSPFAGHRGRRGRASPCTPSPVQDGAGKPVDIEGRGELLAETILAVRAGDAINDALNKLVLGAGLHWREVEVLRAYAGIRVPGRRRAQPAGAARRAGEVSRHRARALRDVRHALRPDHRSDSWRSGPRAWPTSGRRSRAP